MTFDSDSFGVNGDVSQRGKGPTLFTYRTTTESKADVIASGYFDEAKDYLLVGDSIWCDCVDGSFTGTVTGLSPVTIVDRLLLAGGLNSAYGNWELTTPTVLTTTPLVFEPDLLVIQPVNIAETGGVFTVANSGVYSIGLERIYANSNTTSTDYELRIDFVINDVIAFFRTAPIPNAPNAASPAFITFSSPFVFEIADTDEVKIQLSTPTVGTGTDITLERVNLAVKRIA